MVFTEAFVRKGRKEEGIRSYKSALNETSFGPIQSGVFEMRGEK